MYLEGGKRMNWLDYMNAALDYIEENLSIKMDIDQIAAKAGCSTYNFQRMFSFIADMTLAQYIRRRCMTCAALELSQKKTSVIDIAMKYGYDSPVSFARAFQSIQGMSPAEARKEGTSLKLYPKISFQISIKGAVAMNYRIEKMGAFRLAGVSREISMVGGENFTTIPKMWEEFCEDGTCNTIFSMNHREQEEMYGVCYGFDYKDEKFRYMIAAKPECDIPQECEVLEVPSFTWVKFECQGVSNIQDVFKRMNQEWFPTSGYEHADGPEIEWYPIGDMSKEDYKCEVWVPIQKKVECEK